MFNNLISLYWLFSHRQKFLTEFIEVGGVLTLLEIIGLTKITEVYNNNILNMKKYYMVYTAWVGSQSP